jgi:hypothetical protein
VDRSLWRFPKGIGHPERIQLRRGITDVLDAILGPNPHLHYYQGFHEICAVFMLTCGGRSGLELLRILCRCDQPACSLFLRACITPPGVDVVVMLSLYGSARSEIIRQWLSQYIRRLRKQIACVQIRHSLRHTHTLQLHPPPAVRRCHIRDYLEPTLACSIAHCEIVYGVLFHADPTLYVSDLLVSTSAPCCFTLYVPDSLVDTSYCPQPLTFLTRPLTYPHWNATRPGASWLTHRHTFGTHKSSRTHARDA